MTWTPVTPPTGDAWTPVVYPPSSAWVSATYPASSDWDKINPSINTQTFITSTGLAFLSKNDKKFLVLDPT